MCVPVLLCVCVCVCVAHVLFVCVCVCSVLCGVKSLSENPVMGQVCVCVCLYACVYSGHPAVNVLVCLMQCNF